MDDQPTINRREFLQLALVGAASAAGMALLPKMLKPGNEPAASGEEKSATARGLHRWGMVIDQNKCIGCQHCVMACQATNDIAPDIRWTRLYETGPVDGKPVYLPVPCQHCEKAPCVDVCPVKATYHRPDGIVMMDYKRCIGCRYCEVACPYGARSFNWKTFDGENPAVPAWGEPEVARRPRGVVEKCAFCYQRIDRGLEQGLTPGVDAAATPACVNACPTGARVFGDLNDPASAVRQLLAARQSYRLREDWGASPRVYYLPVQSASGG